MDKLDQMFQLQSELAKIMPQGRYPRDIEERVSLLCTAIIHESIELQRLTNWKWWKNPIQFDQKLAKEELIDIWHFVIQTSLELGLSPDDIIQEYQRKNNINIERQHNNY